MAVRRKLADEVKPSPETERSFVRSGKTKSAETPPLPPQPAAAVSPSDLAQPKETPIAELKAQTPSITGRAPLTTRIRADLAFTLKRASFERQLNGIHPQTVQEILEDALEPWFRSNGYL